MKTVLLVLDAALAQILLTRLVATTLTRVVVLKTALQVRYLVPTLYVVVSLIDMSHLSKLLLLGLTFLAECSTLNDANGEFSYSDATGIGSVATLTCNNGFQANNSPATCTQSGQSADWRTTAPNCTRK